MASNRGLVYLDRDNFYYYDTSLSSVLKFDFSSDLICDLEVVNTSALHKEIKSFIENNKISPSSLMIVLSPRVYFEKEFPDTADFHIDSELSKFVDNVPFENTSTKVYKLVSSSKLVATNADLYLGIKIAFEEIFFTVEAIVPAFILGIEIILADSLDTDTARKIIAKFDLAKQNSLLMYHESEGKSPNSSQNRSPKGKENKSLVYSLPVLLFLIIVLAILFLKNSQPAPRKIIYTSPTIPVSRATLTPAENFPTISSGFFSPSPFPSI